MIKKLKKLFQKNEEKKYTEICSIYVPGLLVNMIKHLMENGNKELIELFKGEDLNELCYTYYQPQGIMFFKKEITKEQAKK
jgi:hypothetical protein